MTRDQEKAERLAAQLRANLHRRKAQARGGDAVGNAASAYDEAAPNPGREPSGLISDS
jgi:hypothetical protein